MIKASGGGDKLNSRIFELRKKLDFTQEEIGKKLGVTRGAISRMESGTYKITETMAKLICTEFNVNIEWLVHGKGEMFNNSDVISLDEYAKKNHISDFETEIIKGYLSLSPEVRNEFMEILRAASKVTEGKKILSVVKKEELPPGAPVAAHNDAPLTEEEIRLMREDLDDL